MLRVGIDVRCLESSELRGFARYTLELSAALCERPLVEVVGLAFGEVQHELPFEVARMGGGREVVREQLRLPRALARHGIDVLLCPANRGLPLLSPCPTVLTLHDAVEWDRTLVRRPTGRSAARFAYASVLSLAGATLILTVSAHSATTIEARLGIDPGRLRVVPEGVHRRFFAEPAEEAVRAVRERLGLPEGAVLYVSGFDAKKDVPTLVRAVAELGPDGPPLVLAGATRGADPVRALVGSLGLGDRVTFTGFVDDLLLPALYRTAGCFVFPALAEGFGLPVVEAMASGLPVVVADAGALPEVVGPAGLRFPAGDHVAAASAIRRALDPAERPALVAAARRRAEELTWERAAERTEAVLRDAAATSPSRRTARSVSSLRALPRWVRR
jgi:glycosyltransferase involved in cell wall biosynthesis